MRDRDDGARVLGQEALEPGDRLGVEVVRRLVQQQQVRRGQEQPAERDAPPLAAGQRRHVAVAVGQPQRVHRPVERGRRGSRRRRGRSAPAPCPARRAARRSRRRARRSCAEISLKRSSRSRSGRTPSSTLRRTSFAGSRSGSCGRKPTVAPAARSARPLDGLFDARHDPQQRRLPGAVRPEHPDLRARQERERDVVEHLPLGPVELRGPHHREDVVGRGHSPTLAPATETSA